MKKTGQMTDCKPAMKTSKPATEMDTADFSDYQSEVEVDDSDAADPSWRPSDSDVGESENDDSNMSVEFPALLWSNPCVDISVAKSTLCQPTAEMETAGLAEGDDSNMSKGFPLLHTITTESNPSVTTSVTSSSSTAETKNGITGFGMENLKSKRKDKSHWCLFCGKSTTKLARHFMSFHTSERDLIPWLNASKSQKKVELSKLRNTGDHLHNTSVWETGAGEIVVKRKSALAKSVDEFVPCPDCLAYYRKKDLWRHQCVAKTVKVGHSKSRVIAGRLLLPSHPGSKATHDPDKKLAREILEHVKSDEVGIVVKTDPLIFDLALRETRKNGFDEDRHQYIRNKLREIARLVLALRRICGTPDGRLSDFLKPESFSSVVQATREVAEYVAVSADYTTPSVAKKLGHTIRRCALLMKATAIEKRDTDLQERCRLFLELHEMRWNEMVSSQASRTLYRRRQNHTKRLPLSEDIQKLSAYLRESAKNAKAEMGKASSPGEKNRARQNLCKVLLSQTILFNRRRCGEVSKMKLTDYENRTASSMMDDISQCLSLFEQQLSKSLVRVEIIGKTGRIVPVLLTAEMVDSFDKLIQSREGADIPESNKFIFAQSPSTSSSQCSPIGHIRGHDTLKAHCEEAGLKHPELINSTSLRKHVATMTQLYNLQENEQDLVADYMGHDIRTHRKYYRLPSAALQMAKVAKVLVQMEKGEVSTNMDDIDINDDIEEEEEENEGVNEEDSGEQCTERGMSRTGPFVF